jgi:hypothetical protein
MPKLEEIQEEYRNAYRQLRRLRRDFLGAVDAFEREEHLSLLRYRRARAEYLELALGEDDAIIAELEQEEAE